MITETSESIYYKELARDDLSQYRKAKAKIDRLQEKISQMRNRVNTLNRELNPDKVQVQAGNGGPEDLLCAIVDSENQYFQDCAEAERLCMEIYKRISLLNNETFEAILYHYWIDGMRYEEIALKIHNGYSTVKKYHQQALEAYGILLEKRSPT